MKLQLQHIAPYLPYGLKGAEYKNGELFVLAQIDLTKKYPIIWESNSRLNICRTDCKPILRPLSDLTKEIEVNGEKIVPIVELLKIKHKGWYTEKQGSRYCEIDFELNNNYAKAYFKYHAIHSIDVWLRNTENEPYWVIQKLLEWHFDVFGLIEQKLAIDINTLEL